MITVAFNKHKRLEITITIQYSSPGERQMNECMNENTVLLIFPRMACPVRENAERKEKEKTRTRMNAADEGNATQTSLLFLLHLAGRWQGFCSSVGLREVAGSGGIRTHGAHAVVVSAYISDR